ncbi:MAG: hypothetical protein E6860_18765 [Clostridium sp.]|jgi:hypothetical protein|uniref:hypothetical protein n=1 Tax=Clostridium TaxID=1485 RepID=UPI0023306F24|nr:MULTISPECIES: hypothetical protein [Clostridium]MDB2073962.1 hypothetical protein [Clostridium paraputrificum]MDB2084137.1 hypothetical protein [Clostridium paraputrificum]MDU1587565.1 hypothetical protein [Clostridium sp.]MDY3361153.1 hypothetical protein [Clostridium celatum]
MFSLNKDNLIYVVSVFLFAFIICFTLSILNILPNDNMASTLLALIASNSILREIRKHK